MSAREFRAQKVVVCARTSERSRGRDDTRGCADFEPNTCTQREALRGVPPRRTALLPRFDFAFRPFAFDLVCHPLVHVKNMAVIEKIEDGDWTEDQIQKIDQAKQYKDTGDQAFKTGNVKEGEGAW